MKTPSGIEDWGGRLVKANGKTWKDVKGRAGRRG